MSIPSRSRRLTRLAVIGAAPALLLVTGQLASASAPPTGPPGDSSPATSSMAEAAADATTDFTLPDDYLWVVDDLQTITFAVPETWTDIVTSPTRAPDLTDMSVPYLAASTDVNAFETSFDAAGARMIALPFLDIDPNELVAQYGLSEDNCAEIATEAYSDPVFTGTLFTGSDCGESGATWRIVIARRAEQDVTVVVDVQTLTPADEGAYQVVLDSFALLGGAMAPGSSVPGSSVPGSSVPGSSVRGMSTPATTEST